MLKLEVVMAENFDEENNEFLFDVFVIELEHSLASLSKWEQKFEKPFLGRQEKSTEEVFEYIKIMALNEVPKEVWAKLSAKNALAIDDYINAKMTATVINEMGPKKVSREIITAEVIYHWMVSLQIPFETQHWHLNTLITLVRVCNEKNKPQKKMSRAEAGRRQREINAQRKAGLGTRG